MGPFRNGGLTTWQQEFWRPSSRSASLLTSLRLNFDSWTLNTYGPLHAVAGTDIQQVNFHVDVRGDHATLIRNIGARGTVLLKNVNNALPLNKPKFLAVIRDDAGPNLLQIITISMRNYCAWDNNCQVFVRDLYRHICECPSAVTSFIFLGSKHISCRVSVTYAWSPLVSLLQEELAWFPSHFSSSVCLQESLPCSI